ncbi:M23 family metallopeptidase [Agromyces mariniharenae]|uniref:M23 family metallopeptidase n=1 Tax=Agromyces mariniharenae TaxID=2604423 RepID=A0A5S4UWN4_9MICO|nr:M23 family metallopeptidase [Agromyces mariniharenae]TYL50962.1 M23 family metallopeptidase [Agromyces mariniharenae]HEU0182028.1 M23 family metallopeptidase [Agromyces mariniharenae]
MTAGYDNVNAFIVIAADLRDPFVSWQHHLDRGSSGGVDCVAGIGTAILAPADCELRNIPDNGTGGNTIELRFADGWRDQMMHLSRFVAAGSKAKGAVVGFSGDTGAPGQPHVHWHRIDPDGARRNPWNFFDSVEDDMFTDDDRNRLQSVHAAVFMGGGNAGQASVIERLLLIEDTLAALERRIVNLDRQVTGADNFNADVGPSVAGRLIDVQNTVNRIEAAQDG